jgi:hypothetical protein
VPTDAGIFELKLFATWFREQGLLTADKTELRLIRRPIVIRKSRADFPWQRVRTPR